MLLKISLGEFVSWGHSEIVDLTPGQRSRSLRWCFLARHRHERWDRCRHHISSLFFLRSPRSPVLLLPLGTYSSEKSSSSFSTPWTTHIRSRVLQWRGDRIILDRSLLLLLPPHVCIFRSWLLSAFYFYLALCSSPSSRRRRRLHHHHYHVTNANGRENKRTESEK